MEAISTSPISDNMFALIVPDNLVNGLEPVVEMLNLNFIGNNKDEAKKELTIIFNNDEDKKVKLAQNIIRKSLYEYYVSLKFKYKEEHKMTNIFALRNKQKEQELSSKQIDLVISLIESLWVK